MSDSNVKTPFRFLDLPLELRVMVYEMLPRYDLHTNIHLPPDTPKPFASLTAISRVIPIAILATCKQICNEATEIVHKIARECALETAPLIVYKCGGMAGIDLPYAFDLLAMLLQAINNEYLAIQRARNWISMNAAIAYLEKKILGALRCENDCGPRVAIEVLRENGCEREILHFIRRAAHQLLVSKNNPRLFRIEVVYGSLNLQDDLRYYWGLEGVERAFARGLGRNFLEFPIGYAGFLTEDEHSAPLGSDDRV